MTVTAGSSLERAHPLPSGVIIREASPVDRAEVYALLDAAGLVSGGVLEPGTSYWVAQHDRRIIGGSGLEYGRGAVLLRSIAVQAGHRHLGVGLALTHHALAIARARGYRT